MPIIVVTPVGAGQFDASLDGRRLCRSATPFLAAARVLLAEGVPPDTTIEMRHAGSSTLSLRSTIGKTAGLSVREGDCEHQGPRFIKWRSSTFSAPRCR